MAVRVQVADFDAGAEIARLRAGDRGVGAVASFVGTVRADNDASQVDAMVLEHYAGMTEAVLSELETAARARFDVRDVLVVHRIGVLVPGDQIVLVVVTSAHRDAAFDACRYLMDFLKTEAPFWKKERTPAGERWVEARASDEAAAGRW
ncbi:MAG: molybdenum cofactor biosynthesis protein MoaE [Proteobacteria bacterium]|nr:molybdenum cofactor biosynthesis protein MoaE [Pseudomonadota bacterium]